MLLKAYHAAMNSFTLQTSAQLASHLRSFRKARGLTQAALGQLTGLKQDRIAKIERDPSRVGVRQLLQLLTALNVQVLLAPAKATTGSRKPSDW
jgi:HTH-type transcriptional regulator / antitoxin HipB